MFFMTFFLKELNVFLMLIFGAKTINLKLAVLYNPVTGAG